MPKRKEPTKAEQAKAKAKEIADAAKFRLAAKQEADKYQAEQDRIAEERRKNAR